MLKRSIVLFSFGVAAFLFGVTQTDAQPGGGGRGGKAEIKKIEEELAQLMDQIKDVQAKLARLSAAVAAKKGEEKGKEEKKGFEGGRGFGGFGPGGFGKGGFGPGGFGRGGFGGRGGPDGMSEEVIKERYEFYKKLYEESKSKAKDEAKKSGEQKQGFEFKFKFKGPEGKKGSGEIEARIDRLIRELEEIRSDMKGAKGGPDKKGFEGKKGKKFDEE